MQRIPAEQAFNKADRRNNEEEDKSQNDSGRHERKSFRQCHPCFVWQNENPRKQRGQNDKHRAKRQSNMRQARKLSAVKPPGAQQNQNAADDETEFSFDPKRFLSNHLLVHHTSYQLIIQALHTFPNSHILPEWQTNLWSGLALRLTNCVKFPDDARKEAGFQLRKVQRGGSPTDWKPMPSVGSGVVEIRVHTAQEYRVFYIAKFTEAIYVLHAFTKRTQKTLHRDIQLARRRYSELLRTRSRTERK